MKKIKEVKIPLEPEKISDKVRHIFDLSKKLNEAINDYKKGNRCYEHVNF